MVMITVKASRELKRVGCAGPNFLRISSKHGRKFGCFIDSTLGGSDSVIHDGDIRVVADPSSAPFLKNLSIDLDSSGIVLA